MMFTMRTRALRIAVLVWMAWWCAAFVPAHQRGGIPIEGDPATAGGARGACAERCAADAASPLAPDAPDRPDAPEPVPGQDCGVCHVVAKLDLPQPFHVDLSPLATTEAADVLASSLCPLAPIVQYHGRAPPVV